MYREADADRVYDTLRRWEVSRWLGDDPKVMVDRDEAVRRIAGWRSITEQDPRHGVWAIELRDSGLVVGTLLLVPAPDPEQEYGGAVEVGWHLHPDSWGHGYAREAGAAGLGKGFADGLQEIYAFTHVTNTPSQRVCGAIGMSPVGITTDQWYRGDMALFRSTADEHRAGTDPVAPGRG